MEKLLSNELIFDCPIFRVEAAKVEMPDGSVQDRWYVINPDAVIVIPIDADGNIILIREWMSAAGKWVTKFVAGRIDDKEDPAETTLRELREEIGFGARDIQLYCEMPAVSSWQKQNKYYFIARDLYEAPLDSGDEFGGRLDIVRMKPLDVLQMIEDSDIRGDTAIAVKRYIKEYMQ